MKKKKTQKKNTPVSFVKTSLFLLMGMLVGVLGYKTVTSLNPAQQLTGEFHGSTFPAPQFAMTEPQPDVLGDTSGKRIEVDLSNQRVYGFDGGTKVFDFLVSTGLWGRTPTGEFTIQRKVRSQTMSGGNRAIGTYYYLPNVQWVQFFGNAQIPWSRGFSFHGTYWHNNFGHPMSHGCINMKTPDAQQLYEWAPMGTRVVIYGSI